VKTISQLEQEHAWREILQIQLGEHWLSLYFPEEKKKEPILEKLRNPDGKVA
jgi:hypothetical protein